MLSIRFSVAGLLIIVGLMAVVFGALLHANTFWATGIWTAATAVLLIAIVAARFRPVPSKVFWWGFACCGWGYWVLAFAPGFDSERLLTTHLLRAAYRPVYPLIRPRLEKIAISNVPPDATVTGRSDRQIHYVYGDGRRGRMSLEGNTYWSHVTTISHSLLTLFLALCGGLLALSFSQRRPQPEAQARQP
jgi:hypothetical protein